MPTMVGLARCEGAPIAGPALGDPREAVVLCAVHAARYGTPIDSRVWIRWGTRVSAAGARRMTVMNRFGDEVRSMKATGKWIEVVPAESTIDDAAAIILKRRAGALN